MAVLNTADAVKVGSSDADAVYLGATEVWTGTASVLTAPASVGTVDSNAGWTWYCDPRAVCYSGNRRKMFTGFIRGQAPVADVVVAQYDLDSGGFKEFTLKVGAQRDDHNNPAIVILPDGRLAAFYCNHSLDNVMRYRISTYPEDVSEWGAEQTNVPNVTGSSNFSYTNPFYIASEGRLYLFTRGNAFLPMITYTTDNGATWATPANMVEFIASARPYMKYVSDGTKIHFFGTAGHPRDVASGANHLYHWYYDSADGYFHKSDGTQSLSLATVMAGTKLGAADVTKVYDTSEESTSNHGGNAWTWNIALDGSGRPVVTFTTFPTLDAHRYWYGRWTGSAWDKHVIVSNAGPSLYGLTPQTEDMYSAGVHVDPSDTRVVWLCIMNAGATVSELWKYRTLNGGTTWDSVAVTSSSTKKHFRPYVPVNKLTGAPDVLYNYGDYTTYTNWDSALKSGPALTLTNLPVNSVAPVASGTTGIGDTLTTTNGTWSNTPTGYTYQWRRNGTAISGATASTYVLVSGDISMAITCTVTAGHAAGPSSATSNTLTVPGPPSNTVAPAITPTSASTGTLLTCSTGTWTNSPSSYAYAWRKDGVANGSTGSTYTTVAGDVAHAIDCTVVATNGSGSSAATASSNSVTPSATFNPASITGIWAYYEADSGTSTTTDGVGVSQWDDLSGNGRHVVQATGSKQPLYKTAILNSKPVLRFDGTDDVLSLTSITPPGQANPSDLSLFVVAKMGSAFANGLVSTRDASTGWIFRVTSGNGILFAHITGTPNATHAPANTQNWNLHELVRTALSAKHGDNGTMDASGTAISIYPPASTRLDVGAEAATAATPTTNPLNGDIAGIYIYTTALGSTDRDALEAYVASKWALTIA